MGSHRLPWTPREDKVKAQRPSSPIVNRASQTRLPVFLNCAVRRVNPKSFASVDVEHLGAFVSECANDSARTSGTSAQQGFSGSILHPRAEGADL